MIIEELSYFLGTQGLANVYEGRLPTDPDDCLAVIDYFSLPPGLVHDQPGVIAYEMPRVQVLSRSASRQTAARNAQLASQALARVVNTSIMEAFYLGIIPLSSPFLLERDPNDRTIYACNYQVDKQLSP